MEGSESWRAKLLGKEFVALYTGPEEKTHVLHEKLLVTNSTFFKHIFSPESQRNTSPLKYRMIPGGCYLYQVDSDIFEPVVNFLYRGTVPDLGFNDDLPRDLSKPVELCCLAIDLGMDELADRMVDEFQSYHRYHTGTSAGHFTMGHIRRFIKKTTPHSQLWRYAIASIVCRIAWGSYDDDWSEELRALCLEVPLVANCMVQFQLTHGINIARHSADYRESSHENGFSPCEFHVHTNGKHCHLVTLAKRDGGELRRVELEDVKAKSNPERHDDENVYELNDSYGHNEHSIGTMEASKNKQIEIEQIEKGMGQAHEVDWSNASAAKSGSKDSRKRKHQEIEDEIQNGGRTPSKLIKLEKDSPVETEEVVFQGIRPKISHKPDLDKPFKARLSEADKRHLAKGNCTLFVSFSWSLSKSLKNDLEKNPEGVMAALCAHCTTTLSNICVVRMIQSENLLALNFDSTEFRNKGWEQLQENTKFQANTKGKYVYKVEAWPFKVTKGQKRTIWTVHCDPSDTAQDLAAAVKRLLGCDCPNFEVKPWLRCGSQTTSFLVRFQSSPRWTGGKISVKGQDRRVFGESSKRCKLCRSLGHGLWDCKKDGRSSLGGVAAYFGKND